MSLGFMNFLAPGFLERITNPKKPFTNVLDFDLQKNIDVYENAIIPSITKSSGLGNDG